MSINALERTGFRLIPGFLPSAEAATWSKRIDDCADLFRAVGGKGGLGLPFRLMDGEQAHAMLADALAGLQPRMLSIAEGVAGRPLEPIRDVRRGVRIQRYRGRKEGFRWHFDGSRMTALLTLSNSSGGATEIVSPRWTPVLKPLFYLLYPLRSAFSILPRTSIVAKPGDLLILNGSAVLHRGTAGVIEGERVVLLVAFDLAGTRPRPFSDWIARTFND